MLVKKNVLNEINKKGTQDFKDCRKINRKVSQNLDKSNQIKSTVYFFLQVYFGPINSTLYLHVKKLTIACNTFVERILVSLNLV